MGNRGLRDGTEPPTDPDRRINIVSYIAVAFACLFWGAVCVAIVAALWEDGGWHNMAGLAVTCAAVTYVYQINTKYRGYEAKPAQDENQPWSLWIFLSCIWGAFGAWVASSIKGNKDGWISYIFLVIFWGAPMLHLFMNFVAHASFDNSRNRDPW